MSWLSDRLGIHVNLRPLAPIAGGIVGNMLLPGIGGAALGSGLGRFVDGIGNGENFGQAAKSGAITGGLTYGGGKAIEALRGAFSPSSAPGANIGTGVARQAADPAAEELTGGLPSAASTARGGESWLGRVGAFAEKHPNAIGAGLQGLGSIAGASQQNALARAEAQRMEAQTQQEQYALEQQRRRDAALEPLRRALAGQLGNLQMGGRVAPNPYGVA